MIEIRNRWNSAVIRTVESDSLREADLSGANLYGANLRWADLSGADLYGANLRGAKINWNSHDLIAEILRKAASDDVDRRKVAGLILVSRDWCWRTFLELNDPLYDWALDVLASWAKDDPDAPEALSLRTTDERIL